MGGELRELFRDTHDKSGSATPQPVAQETRKGPHRNNLKHMPGIGYTHCIQCLSAYT